VSQSTVHVEDLLGRAVTSADGRRVGRIEEVVAERRGHEHEVAAYLLGPGALLERLGVLHRLLGRKPRTCRVRWDQLDISSPDRPRLTCSPEELETR